MNSDTPESPARCVQPACSALAAALALIALGPQRRANAIEWLQVSLEMCKHCLGTETVNEAAARIVAEWLRCYEERLKIIASDAAVIRLEYIDTISTNLGDCIRNIRKHAHTGPNSVI